MEILVFVLVFTVGAIFAAFDGDFSGIEIIVKVVAFFLIWFGMMYCIASCMGI